MRALADTSSSYSGRRSRGNVGGQTTDSAKGLSASSQMPRPLATSRESLSPTRNMAGTAPGLPSQRPTHSTAPPSGTTPQVKDTQDEFITPFQVAPWESNLSQKRGRRYVADAGTLLEKEVAIEEHLRQVRGLADDASTLVVYTDGSRHAVRTRAPATRVGGVRLRTTGRNIPLGPRRDLGVRLNLGDHTGASYVI